MRLQSNPSVDKKVILIIVDSLLDEPLQTLMNQNNVPAFSFLKEHGFYTNQMISSFPTMSVTIDSTILTGTYPNHHHIPALRWYNYEENRLIQYGDGVFPILQSGVKQVMVDSLFHLNNTHLASGVSTIHEELADRGLTTGSINTLVYRGKQKQLLHIPGPFQDMETNAPDYFVLGTFHKYQQNNLKEQFLDYYGVNNAVSNKHLLDIIKNHSLPSFTMLYLPDLDHEAHKQSENSMKSVIQVDHELQKILNAFGSWEEAIQHHVFIVMGDSGINKIINDKKEAIIDLEEIFYPYRIADLRKTEPADELSLAVNERMAYIYPLHPNIRIEDLVHRLKTDSRLDTISWKNEDWIEVVQGGSGSSLRFRPGSDYTDSFEQKWDMEGNLNVLDLQIDQNRKRISFGSYPDAFMRLFGALHSHPGNFLVATSHPGYEMKGESSVTHVNGGAHGSLVDSLVPLFITGEKSLPQHLRMVDLKPYILDILSLP